MRLDNFSTTTLQSYDIGYESGLDVENIFDVIESKSSNHRPFLRNDKGVITIDFGDPIIDPESNQSSQSLTGTIRAEPLSLRQRFRQIDLDLSDQNISDINALSNLTQFTQINLSYNQIRDIEPLGKLQQVTDLRLNHNQIKDISIFARLPRLELINIENNEVTDISAISQLGRLKTVVLSDNHIKDISP